MTGPAARNAQATRQRRWARPIVTGAAAASAVVVLALGACSTDTADAVPTRLAGAGSTSTATATATATTTSTSAAPTDPRVAAVVAANGRLTASLFSVVQSLKKMQGDNTLSDLRQKLGTANTAAREALKRQRSAAYPSETRSCTTVRSNAEQVTARSNEGYAVRRLIASRVALLGSDIAALRTATTSVSTDRDALAAALKGVTNPPVTVAPADVSTALTDALDRRFETFDAIGAVTTASSEAGTALGKFVTQSRQILVDACS